MKVIIIIIIIIISISIRTAASLIATDIDQT